MKVTMVGRTIPRNEAGDPAFTRLEAGPVFKPTGELEDPGVLVVFTPAEVVELVNRCLYQLEYQARSHAKRSAEQTTVLRPVKNAVRRLFQTSWAKATPQQVSDAMTRLKEDPTLGDE